MNAPDPDTIPPLAEEAFDRWAGFVEGPVNRVAERVFKSKVFLAPLGLGWTLSCRSLLAMKHARPSVLWRGVDAIDDR